MILLLHFIKMLIENKQLIGMFLFVTIILCLIFNKNMGSVFNVMITIGGFYSFFIYLLSK